MNAMTNETVLAALVSIAAEQSGISADKLTIDSRFVDDIGCDSLDLIEVVMAVEEHFNIDIDDEEAETLKTIGDAASLVMQRIAGADGDPDGRVVAEAQDTLDIQPVVDFKEAVIQDPWAMVDASGALKHLDIAQARAMAAEFSDGNPREDLFLATLVVAVLDMAADVAESLATKTGDGADIDIGKAIRSLAVADGHPYWIHDDMPPNAPTTGQTDNC